MGRIVIASAAAFETDPLVDRLASARVDFTRLTTGVGLTEASMTCARLTDVIRSRFVFFICTGGTIGSDTSLRTFSARRVSLRPYDVRHGFSQLVNGCDPDIILEPLNFGYELVDAAGSLGVSVHSEICPPEGLIVETMELYGVARAWQHHAKRLTAFVTVTNTTGPLAREQWRNQYKDAAQMAADQLAPKILAFISQKVNQQ
jgi:hypothetical protein